MSKDKRVYNSESVKKANTKFMLKHHVKAERKPAKLVQNASIRKMQMGVDPAEPGKDEMVIADLNVDQTRVGDE